MKIRTAILTVACLVAAEGSSADVLVKAEELGSGLSEIRIDKDWARLLELSTPQQFMLVDLKKHVSYMADQDKKIMLRMDDMHFASTEAQSEQNNLPKPKVTLTKTGGGPTVAGFETSRYVLKANNQLCSEHFISMDALKIPEIKSFSKSIEKLAKSPQYMTEHETPCGYAEIEFEQMAFNKGIPLLTKNNRGKVTFRVLEVNTNITFSEHEVAPPSDYEMVSAQQMMHREMTRALNNR